jgi:arginyl-tRNA--protein-N-Asp/Glu arginylyltransferase
MLPAVLQPDNQTTCCRQYTIRLDVTDYQPAKAHRKLLRKWEHYLAGGPPAALVAGWVSTVGL